jgi:hypothetical protein
MSRAQLRRAVAVALVAVVSAGGAAVTRPAPAPAAAAPACHPAAAGEAQAMAMARACGKRVELEPRRTATTQLFANPDGTVTIEQYAAPQRGRRADGSWAPLDATLEHRPDGTLAPRVSTVDLSLSGGGRGAFARVTRDGGEVALNWPGKLPEPRVAGARATYPEVFPGVDLVATAGTDGFSFVLVVKSRTAAANPALRRLTLGSALKGGLRWHGTRAVDGRGHTVLSATAPLMWDSTSSSTVDAPGEGARRRPVDFAVDRRGRLSLTPDAGLLSDPSARYPVYVDPDIRYSLWTMINEGAPNQSYWAKDRQDCSGPHRTDCAKVGYWPTGNEGAAFSRYRSMFEFSAAPWQGRQVLAGTRFTIDILHSSICGATTTYLHAVRAGINSGMTWNNNAGQWHVAVASAAVSTCSYARKGTEFAMSAESLAEQVDGRLVLGLKAQNEGSSDHWKKFDATTAKLIVNVNAIPGTPSGLTVDGRDCVTGPDRPWVATVTPTLRAWVSDEDTNSLTATFERRRHRDDGSRGPISPRTQGGVPSGTQAQVTLNGGVLDNGDQFVGTGDWNRDGRPDVLSRDGDGYLYLHRGGLPSSWQLSSRAQLGTGWHASEFTIAGVADWDRDGYLDVVTRGASTGQLWLYPGAATANGFHGGRFDLGNGWNDFTFAGLADWDRDGYVDVLARDGAGLMWLYPGDGRRAPSTQGRVNLGNGWGGFTYFGTPDWDRDGAPDVVARDPSTGQLWLYPGTGRRVGYDGNPYRWEIGSGWWDYAALTVPDVNGDGTVDILAVQLSNGVWYAYPGLGTRGGEGAARWTVAARGVSNDGIYEFRARAADANISGPESGWCEFGVDIARPNPASVVADVYKQGAACAPCGSVGQTGRFTFSSSADVTSFRWGFSDPPTTVATPPTRGGSVTVEWTPQTGGAKTLYVTAVDRAGNESRRTYQFTVLEAAPPLARWRLDDPAGATAITDDSGNDRPLTPRGGAMLGAPGRYVPGPGGGSRTALWLDGVDDYAARPKLLDTTRSFSVSAWVKLDATGRDHSIIAQNGSNYAAFYLYYAGRENKWVFMAPGAQVDPQPAWWSAWSTSTPRAGVWTHLAGTYDSVARQLRLYVNGVLEATAGGAVLWDATGEFHIGRSLGGAVAEVHAWPRMITAEEAYELADPVVHGPAGEWHLEEVGPGPAYDASAFGRDLTFAGDAHIPPDGTGLRLDGTGDHAATDGPVLRTDQSFTVSASARLSDSTVAQTFLAQAGSGTAPAFRLGYDPTGHWVFAVPGGSVTLPATVLNAYHRLAGVLDVQRRELRIHLDGSFTATAPLPATWQPAASTGRLLIGTAGTSSYTRGDLDEVVVYQGAVVDVDKLMPGTDRLLPGQRLQPGQHLRSAQGHHELVMQFDGNLVFKRAGVVRWGSGTAGNPGAYAQMQTDGNFVVYTGTTALWSSRSWATAADRLVLHEELGPVLLGPNQQVFWRAEAGPPVGKVIWLRSRSNGKLVATRTGEAEFPLKADSDTFGPAEQFEVVDVGGGQVALRAVSAGRYVVAWASVEGKPLRANSVILGAWERFRWSDVDGGVAYLVASSTSGYVLARADEAGSPLRADGIQGEWEKFAWGLS